MQVHSRVRWVSSIAILVTAMYAVSIYGFYTGASSVRLMHVTNVDLRSDGPVWQIAELAHGVGLYYDARDLGRSEVYYSLIDIGTSMPPLGMLCGSAISDGEILSVVEFEKDGWLYSDAPWPGYTAAWNRHTGERVLAERTTEPTFEVGRARVPEEEPAFVRLGLTFDPAHRIDFATLLADARPLPTQNEDCVIVHVAFWFVYLLLFGAAGLVWLVSRARRPRPS
jgi:hypothetical protein